MIGGIVALDPCRAAQPLAQAKSEPARRSGQGCLGQREQRRQLGSQGRVEPALETYPHVLARRHIEEIARQNLDQGMKNIRPGNDARDRRILPDDLRAGPIERESLIVRTRERGNPRADGLAHRPVGRRHQPRARRDLIVGRHEPEPVQATDLLALDRDRPVVRQSCQQLVLLPQSPRDHRRLAVDETLGEAFM